MFHEFGFARVVFGQSIKRVVQLEELNVIPFRCGGIESGGAGADFFKLASMSNRTFTARTINQDTPHAFGRSGEKLRAILPKRLRVPSESQPRLMHERGRLQRLPRGFARHFRRRELAQFVIHERQNLIGRLRVARPGALEQPSDIAVIGFG